MSRNKKKSHKKKDKNEFKIDLYKCPMIQKSKKGYTFKMTGEAKIIKVFFKEKRCMKTYNLLLKLKPHKEFPNVYYKEGNLFVMDEMKGLNMKKYLKANGLTKDMCGKIVSLIDKMKRLKFTRLDIKLKNIYVDDKGELMVMPYKNSMTKRVDHPMNLCKGFRKLGILNEFLEYLKEYKPGYYNDWVEKVKKSIEPNSNLNYGKSIKDDYSNTPEKSFKDKFKGSINFGEFMEMRMEQLNDMEFVPFSKK